MKNITSILIIVAFVAVGYFLVSDSSNGNYIYIGGQKIKVDLAVTMVERTQGLSGRESLAEDEGLLFIFDTPDKYAFWMKDMNFPIDIIWLAPSDGDSKNLKIVYIKHNATPESFPESFGPDQDARYILEVVSGFSEKNNLKVGDSVIFNY